MEKFEFIPLIHFFFLPVNFFGRTRRKTQQFYNFLFCYDHFTTLHVIAENEGVCWYTAHVLQVYQYKHYFKTYCLIFMYSYFYLCLFRLGILVLLGNMAPH